MTDSMYNYINILSQAESAQQLADQLAQKKDQTKDLLKESEDTAGVFGIKSGIEKIVEQTKQTLRNKIKSATNDLKDKVKNKLDEAKSDIKERILGKDEPEEKPVEEPRIAEGYSNINESDSIQDIINDPEKFTEYSNEAGDETLNGLYNQLGYNKDVPEDIENMRNILKDIIDNPQSDAEKQMSEQMKSIQPLKQEVKQEAKPEEQQIEESEVDYGFDTTGLPNELELADLSNSSHPYISLLGQPAELTGGLRGDSTLARVLQNPQENISELSTTAQEQVSNLASVGQDAVNNISQQVTDNVSGLANQATEFVGQAGTKISNVASDLATNLTSKISSVGTEIGSKAESLASGVSDAISDAVSTGLDTASEVVSSIPGLDVLAPLLLLGGSVFEIFHQPKLDKPEPVFNPSSQL